MAILRGARQCNLAAGRLTNPYLPFRGYPPFRQARAGNCSRAYRGLVLVLDDRAAQAQPVDRQHHRKKDSSSLDSVSSAQSHVRCSPLGAASLSKTYLKYMNDNAVLGSTSTALRLTPIHDQKPLEFRYRPRVSTLSRAAAHPSPLPRAATLQCPSLATQHLRLDCVLPHCSIRGLRA